MAGKNEMLEPLINCRVYNDAQDLIGIATVDLPEIQPMNETVSGAGIAGEVEVPIMGHFQSMSATFHWKGVDRAAFRLAAFKAHALEVRGSQQVYDAAGGEYRSVPVRVVLRGVPKNLNLASFEAGAVTEVETEMEVNYMKVFVDGKEVCEIDKYNYISKFGGKDYLQSVRSDLGLN